MASGPDENFKEHPFYIFAKGVVTGVAGVLALINIIEDNYILKKNATSFLEKEHKHIVLETKQYDEMNDQIVLQKETITTLQCKLERFLYSIEEQTIHEGRQRAFFHSMLDITFDAARDKPLDDTKTKNTKNTSPYREAPYFVSGTVHISDGNINEPFDDIPVGESIYTGNYDIYIKSATNTTATFKVYNKKETSKKCD
jgi:hypothetical protein